MQSSGNESGPNAVLFQVLDLLVLDNASIHWDQVHFTKKIDDSLLIHV